MVPSAWLDPAFGLVELDTMADYRDSGSHQSGLSSMGARLWSNSRQSEAFASRWSPDGLPLAVTAREWEAWADTASPHHWDQCLQHAETHGLIWDEHPLLALAAGYCPPLEKSLDDQLGLSLRDRLGFRPLHSLVAGVTQEDLVADVRDFPLSSRVVASAAHRRAEMLAFFPGLSPCLLLRMFTGLQPREWEHHTFSHLLLRLSAAGFLSPFAARKASTITDTARPIADGGVVEALAEAMALVCRVMLLRMTSIQGEKEEDLFFESFPGLLAFASTFRPASPVRETNELEWLTALTRETGDHIVAGLPPDESPTAVCPRATPPLWASAWKDARHGLRLKVLHVLAALPAREWTGRRGALLFAFWRRRRTDPALCRVFPELFLEASAVTDSSAWPRWILSWLLTIVQRASSTRHAQADKDHLALMIDLAPLVTAVPLLRSRWRVVALLLLLLPMRRLRRRRAFPPPVAAPSPVPMPVPVPVPATVVGNTGLSLTSLLPARQRLLAVWAESFEAASPWKAASLIRSVVRQTTHLRSRDTDVLMRGAQALSTPPVPMTSAPLVPPTPSWSWLAAFDEQTVATRLSVVLSHLPVAVLSTLGRPLLRVLLQHHNREHRIFWIGRLPSLTPLLQSP